MENKLIFIANARSMASSLPNLAIIFLREFIALNVNTKMLIKNVKFVKLNISILTFLFNTQILKMM